MSGLAAALLRRTARMLAVLLLVAFGTTLLVRFAPGYLSDAREMDARYAGNARTELAAEAARSASIPGMLHAEYTGWLHGDFGRSRQFDLPVPELIAPRLPVTGGLMLRSVALAWLLAAAAALIGSLRPRTALLWHLPATVLLAVPSAALATLCLIAGYGGPVAALTLLLVARDFKFLDRVLSGVWREPHLLQARAQGMRLPALIRFHVLPGLAPQLLALATLSLLTALSAMVPIEVIFSVPGVGQLAWNAALNRDLPVLLAVTMLMAVAVTFSGALSGGPAEARTA